MLTNKWSRVLTQFYSYTCLWNLDPSPFYAQLAMYFWSIMMSAYATVEVRDPSVLGNCCWHVYMEILYFPFKAILLYNNTHFIEKQFDDLTAKATPWQEKTPGTIAGFKRSKKHEAKQEGKWAYCYNSISDMQKLLLVCITYQLEKWKWWTNR